MGLIPNTKSGKVAFFNSKITPWTSNTVAIGTTSAAITDLTTKLAAASDKMDAQIAAQAAAKAATAAADDAVATLVAAGSDIIKQVRIKASTAGDGVYELAQIPAPATPSPIGPLGKPYDFTVELDQTGALNLKWKCTNPVGAAGTVYQIYRRIGSDGEFTYLGGVGSKKFIDGEVPAGTAQVQYQIQAVRSTSVGPYALFIVNFGAAPAEGTMSVTEAAPARLAA